MKKFDLSEYEFSDSEKYSHLRRDNKYFNLQMLHHNVMIDDAKKEITISVDSYIENEAFLEEKQKMQDMHEDFYENRDKYEYPYLCKYSGENILSNIGERLLEFCYSEINNDSIKSPLLLASLGDPKYRDELSSMFGEYTESKEDIVKVKSSEDLLAEKKYRYEKFSSITNELLHDKFYMHTFPVELKDISVEAYIYYFEYLLMLQSEFKELIEFCLDIDSNKEFFEGESSNFKYKFYCMHIVKHQLKQDFKEEWFFDRHFKHSDDETAQILQDLGNKKLQITEFEKKYDLNPMTMEITKLYDYYIKRSYVCSSLYDMLCLEFLKMIEHDIKIKRCKYCGEYFILKGNYKTNYCYDIKDGQTKTCQQIASQKNYDDRVKKNPEIALYNKYYKKLFARKKVGTLKEQTFKKWKYQAIVMRDRCINGEISIDEFEIWLSDDGITKKKGL